MATRKKAPRKRRGSEVTLLGGAALATSERVDGGRPVTKTLVVGTRTPLGTVLSWHESIEGEPIRLTLDRPAVLRESTKET